MDQEGHSCVRQLFKQTGLQWALSKKTKVKEKMFVLSYVEF